MYRERLGIVSDTAITRNGNGDPLGYEPVVAEIRYFLKHWRAVKWLGYRQHPDVTVYSRPLSQKIEVIEVRPTGGEGLLSKLSVVVAFPILLAQVFKIIWACSEIHVRAPAHPALAAMILAPFFRKKIFWFKYAGSWVDRAPWTYRLQRNLLKKISKNKDLNSIF